jgi:UDP-GlcNAc:undecaprenyl-phosphate GlcNAc-1-phosphate transferase
MLFFSTLLLALFITIALIPPLKSIAVRCEVVDLPNVRKVHCSPMPKIGGVAMAVGIILPVLFWEPGSRFVGALLAGAGVLVVVGFVDDIINMDYRGKLAGQAIAALLVVGYGGLTVSCLGDCLPDVVVPVWAALPLSLLTIIGVTNAINLSDGLDGLAGGISMMIFICLGFVAYQNDMTSIVLLSVAVVGAIFGFLRFNTHPAVIFMGDAGSLLLGFLAVSMALYVSQNSEPISRAFPLLLLGFPILDTLTVMLERIHNGMSPFKADKNHFHHKLMRIGLSHAEAVVVIYGLQFVLVLSAFLLRFHSEWTLLSVYLGFCIVVLVGFYWADKTGWKLPQRDFLDRLIEGNLAFINKRHLFIKACYGMLEIGTQLVFFVYCLTLRDVPVYLGTVAMVLMALIFIVWLVKKAWMLGALRLVLFAMIPYLVFMSQLNLPAWGSIHAQFYTNLAFAALAFLAVMTLKFTRRHRGFKANPFDYLIIFTSFIITSIPEIKHSVEDISLITAKMIALFFAFEVMLGETRGEVVKLNIFMLIALGTVAVKAFI